MRLTEEELETENCIDCGAVLTDEQARSNVDDMRTGTGPFCDEHYDETYTAAYWAWYDREESRGDDW